MKKQLSATKKTAVRHQINITYIVWLGINTYNVWLGFATYNVWLGIGTHNVWLGIRLSATKKTLFPSSLAGLSPHVVALALAAGWLLAGWLGEGL